MLIDIDSNGIVLFLL